MPSAAPTATKTTAAKAPAVEAAAMKAAAAAMPLSLGGRGDGGDGRRHAKRGYGRNHGLRDGIAHGKILPLVDARRARLNPKAML
jgi:hypothetical protein